MTSQFPFNDCSHFNPPTLSQETRAFVYPLHWLFKSMWSFINALGFRNSKPVFPHIHLQWSISMLHTQLLMNECEACFDVNKLSTSKPCSQGIEMEVGVGRVQVIHTCCIDLVSTQNASSWFLITANETAGDPIHSVHIVRYCSVCIVCRHTDVCEHIINPYEHFCWARLSTITNRSSWARLSTITNRSAWARKTEKTVHIE